MASVLFPLPDHDFDITESAVPWKLLSEAGHDVQFATENGEVPAADPLLIDGVVFGQLGAEPEPLSFYREMIACDAYRSPSKWTEIDADAYDALWLTGGHAPGMKQYLESDVLREKVEAFSSATSRWRPSATAFWSWRVRRTGRGARSSVGVV